jgi:uncharacterized protein (DUF1800 family)
MGTFASSLQGGETGCPYRLKACHSDPAYAGEECPDSELMAGSPTPPYKNWRGTLRCAQRQRRGALSLRFVAWIFLFAFSSITLASEKPLTEEQKIVHVLNRLGYGPRPGDVERIRQIGLEKYIEQQLYPEKIDDSALEKKLDEFEILKMRSGPLMKDYYQEIKRFIQNQKAMGGSSDEMKASYGLNVGKDAKAAEAETQKTPQERLKDLESRISLRVVGELQNAKIIAAIESERQLYEVLVDFWSNHFNIDVKKGASRVLKAIDDREVIRPHVLGKFRDLLGASAKSPAMLFYLDNVGNTTEREMSVMEQRMRNHVIGKFAGVSMTTQDPSEMKPKKEGGVNENYGREILELHTLGVDGGYSQKDVQEVSRCFTGWGYHFLNGNFEFHGKRHDAGEKTVLGQTIPAGGGMKDGERVLDLLASHPSTAKFISSKLCRRFISDDPPQALVDRVSQVFIKTDGDLREVVRAIITSPEFFSSGSYRSKIKSSFEFAVSAVRAMDGSCKTGDPYEKVRHALEGGGTIAIPNGFISADKVALIKKKSLNWNIYEMGQPLFAFAAPTGYPEDSKKWVSTGALVARLNFATALTTQNVLDAIVDPATLMNGSDIDQPNKVLDRLLKLLLHGEVSESTRKTLMKEGVEPAEKAGTVDVAQITGLILGSPEFQRR